MSSKSAARPAPTATNQLKPCNICNGKSCVVIPSLASTDYLCLLHYYTTGTHRHRPRSSKAGTNISAKKNSLLVERDRIQQQLPEVQKIFAEAFVELQQEIGEESARAFELAANAKDPLALLLESTSSNGSGATKPSFRSQRPLKRKSHLSNEKGKKAKRLHDGENHEEGGFIREIVLPEKLRKLQNPNVNLDGFTNKHSKDSISASHNVTKNPSNPYQKKQNPTKNIWNQVLDSNDNNNSEKKPKTKWEDVEKEMISNITSGSNASTKTCTCGSTNVEINGNITSRNNDMMKGEVWGMKNRSEVVIERCYCLNCGKTWNEE